MRNILIFKHEYDVQSFGLSSRGVADMQYRAAIGSKYATV